MPIEWVETINRPTETMALMDLIHLQWEMGAKTHESSIVAARPERKRRKEEFSFVSVLCTLLLTPMIHGLSVYCKSWWLIFAFMAVDQSSREISFSPLTRRWSLIKSEEWNQRFEENCFSLLSLSFVRSLPPWKRISRFLRNVCSVSSWNAPRNWFLLRRISLLNLNWKYRN